tara:strand:- start:359 stop:637 length:279 start_codon:yes stop_codon:yes gene_type:complete
MAKYNFTKTSETRISLYAERGEIEALDRFLTEHGDFNEYELLGRLHRDLRDMLVKSTKDIAEDMNYAQEYKVWSKPIEYKIQVKDQVELAEV